MSTHSPTALYGYVSTAKDLALAHKKTKFEIKYMHYKNINLKMPRFFVAIRQLAQSGKLDKTISYSTPLKT
jgi:hypothetical protein